MDTTEAVLHSVVVPVFTEAEAVERFHERCGAAMSADGNEYEVIYVDGPGGLLWRASSRSRWALWASTLGRIHTEARHRPLYLMRDVRGFSSESPDHNRQRRRESASRG